MKILFMGTPDFAVFSLEALCNGEDEIVGVITQPDKPRGRGYVLTPPPVKAFALEKGIPVYQPNTLRDETFAALLEQLAPELIVVVAYGKILPKNVLDFPRYGCINVHGSLLPRYRGAAPMQRAIMDGDAVTGITTMYMAEGLDTGDMLLKSEVAIEDEDNFESIHDKLGVCGAETLLRTVAQLKNGTLVATPQNDADATYAAKIEKADCLLDFSADAKAVHDRIRGLSPIPLSFTHTPDGKMLKVLQSRVLHTEAQGAAPGTVLSLENDCITVACGKDAIALLRVLPEGKKAMSAADYIRGRKLSVGDLLQ